MGRCWGSWGRPSFPGKQEERRNSIHPEFGDSTSRDLRRIVKPTEDLLERTSAMHVTLSTEGGVEATLEGGGERQKGLVGCSIWIHCVVTGGGGGMGRRLQRRECGTQE